MLFPHRARLQYGVVDMFHLKQRMKWLEGSAGQGLTEYALILLFVAIALALAVGAFGQALSDYYMDAISKTPFG
jgi:Flp pilus assembly pilin Flp